MNFDGTYTSTRYAVASDEGSWVREGFSTLDAAEEDARRQRERGWPDAYVIDIATTEVWTRRKPEGAATELLTSLGLVPEES